MLLCVTGESVLKKKSEEYGIPFSDLLKGFVLEEALRLICTSEYKDVLWFANDQILGVDQYRRKSELVIEFYYRKSERKIDPQKLTPGQELSWKMAAYMFAMIFRKERSEQISWKGATIQRPDGVQWNLIGEFQDMQVPLVVRIFPLQFQHPISEKAQFVPIMGWRPVDYIKYSAENQFSEHLFHIISRLELISDMQSYWIVDNILKSQTISGRHTLEYLHMMAEREPKVLKLRRVKQLKEYRSYSYMKARWEKYLRNKLVEGSPWEEVVDRLVKFAEPVWRALCDDEVFFDDWMPGLERFLG